MILKMTDYVLFRSRFAQSFLIRFCMIYAYTRPRYQMSVNRTIGPLVYHGSIPQGPVSLPMDMIRGQNLVQLYSFICTVLVHISNSHLSESIHWYIKLIQELNLFL